jgi:hypothetical protein
MMKAVVSLAGPLAEQRYSGVSWQELVSGAARTDIKSALSALARLGDPAPSLDALIEFARALVFFQWPAILSVAHALVQRRELDRALPLLRRQTVRGHAGAGARPKTGSVTIAALRAEGQDEPVARFFTAVLLARRWSRSSSGMRALL